MTQSRRRNGFTLVELITAAGLMVFVMLGVVQIYAIVTEAAGEGEAMAHATQQLRATFNSLDRDLRGATREGYLRLSKGTTSGKAGESANYESHALALTTIGNHHCDMYQSSDEAETTGTAAEVLYTTNVLTPDEMLRVGDTSDPNSQVDHRRGVLGRGKLVLTGRAGATEAMIGAASDRSEADFLGKLYVDSSLRNRHSSMQIYPWRPGQSVNADQLRTLSRLMANCVSDFYVEYWDEQEESFETAPAQGKTFGLGDAWPAAIRVTVVCHDPNDRTPLPRGQDPDKFKGYVLQQVFYLGNR